MNLIDSTRHTRRQMLIGTVGAAGVAVLGSGAQASASSAPAAGDPAPRPVGFTLPAPTGVFPVGVVEVHLRQPGRADPWVPSVTRELMISIWYPARPSGDTGHAPYLPPPLAGYYRDNPPVGLPAAVIDWAAAATHAKPRVDVLPRAGGYPVVLYSPGGGNSRAFGTILVQELASRGCVVVTVDHTHETAVAFPDGRLEVDAIPANPPDINAAKQLYMDSREADVLFVLDQLEVIADGGNPDVDGTSLPAGLAGSLNLAAVGMFGHSAGGVTASRAVRDDDRLIAGINMEGFFEFGENHPELGEHDPFLLMGARSDPSYPPLLGKPRTHRTDPLWQEFWSHCTGYRLDLNIPAGRHYTYTDLQWWLPQLATPLGMADDQVAGLIGTVEPRRTVAAEATYVAAFFEQTLRHRPQRVLTGPSPWFPQVRFIG